MRKFLVFLTALTLTIGGSLALSKAVPNPDELTVAFLPDEDAYAVIRDNQCFKEYLGSWRGMKLKLIGTTEYFPMIEAIRDERIDLSIACLRVERS